jgi:hypothetical protein
VAAGDVSQHHEPAECWRCGSATIRRERSRHVFDYWWCPRCATAYQCACEGCEVLRALALMDGPL